jgi:hypothetical protein
MRRPLVSLGIFLSSFIFTSPAFAISYSGSTLLDFSNFSFSGISITNLSSSSQFQVQSNDVAGPAGHQGDGAAFFTPWENHTEVNSIPGVITAVTVADGSQLSTSVTMNVCCIGTTADPYSSRFGSFIANEAGNLSIAIPFSLTHSGVPSPITGFSSIARASLSLGGISTSAKLDAAFGSGSRHGILSLTRFFGAGETGGFGLETSINAAYRSVPAPDLLWPTLAGMIGIVFLAEWKRLKEARSLLTDGKDGNSDLRPCTL